MILMISAPYPFWLKNLFGPKFDVGRLGWCCDFLPLGQFPKRRRRRRCIRWRVGRWSRDFSHRSWPLDGNPRGCQSPLCAACRERGLLLLLQRVHAGLCIRKGQTFRCSRGGN